MYMHIPAPLDKNSVSQREHGFIGAIPDFGILWLYIKTISHTYTYMHVICTCTYLCHSIKIAFFSENMALLALFLILRCVKALIRAWCAHVSKKERTEWNHLRMLIWMCVCVLVGMYVCTYEIEGGYPSVMCPCVEERTHRVKPFTHAYLHFCLCLCRHVCVYAWNRNVSMCQRTKPFTHAYVHVCIWVHVDVCMYVDMCVCTWVCMCVRMK